MAIRLLGHFWRVATPVAEMAARQRARDWGVESREPSQWNPDTAAADIASPPQGDLRPPDAVWPETQPWWHD